MKKTILLLNFVIIFSFAYAQEFPSPQNFEIEVCYNNPYGTCGFEYPEYSTIYTYRFNTPDTAGIEATLIEYNIYYNNLSNTTLVYTISDTIFTDLALDIGELYVTAVYSEPEGESAPSNIVISEGNMLNIEKNDLQNEILIFPNPLQLNQKLKIETTEQIEKITVLDITGKTIIKTTKTEIDFYKQKTGVYFLKIETKNTIFTKKIIINH